MLLSKYDFYGIHKILVGIRFSPEAPYNVKIISATLSLLTSAPDGAQACGISEALSSIEGLDERVYGWVKAVDTKGGDIIKEDAPYKILTEAFRQLLKYAEAQDHERLRLLADALHNLPMFFANGGKDPEKEAAVDFALYNKTYNTDLLSALQEERL